jgi:multicomponent Na+:H+ antiporter subunit E
MNGDNMCILLFLLWIIWNGRLSVEILLFGVLMTVLAFLFAIKVLGYSLASERRFWRNLPLFLLYTVNLIREIFKAALAVALLALDAKGKPDPVIVEFHSGLPTDFQNVLLANSITLTPGTYTLFQDKDHFVVHCLRREYAEGMDSSSFVELLRKVK